MATCHLPSLFDPEVWTDSEVLSTPKLNEEFYRPAELLINRPSVAVWLSEDVDIVTDEWTDIPYDRSLLDTDGMFLAGHGGRLKVKTPGIYEVTASVRWDQFAGSGYGRLAVTTGGLSTRTDVAYATGGDPAGGTWGLPSLRATVEVSLARGATIGCRVLQNSGDVLAVKGAEGGGSFGSVCHLSAHWVGGTP